MRRLPAACVLAGAAVAAAVVPSPGAGAAPAAVCSARPVTSALKSTLLRVHRASLASTAVKTSGPVGRVYHGRCPKAFYALASFGHRTPQGDFGLQDQPERFRRRPGEPWQDLGDTGGSVCDAAPKALLKRWGLLEGCG